MNLRRYFFAIGVAVLAVPGWGRDITYVFSETNGKKQIVFESQAPTESMVGRAERISGTVTMDPVRPDLALRALITVPVASMTTDLPMRDEHMMDNEWLDAKRYPGIRFDLMGPASKATSRGKDTWFVNAVGQFTLKGVARSITVPTTIRHEKSGTEDRLILEGRFPVPLEEHNIHGPLAMRMIGLKVAPIVQVSFKLIGVADAAWNGGWPAMPKKIPAKKKSSPRQHL